MKTAFLIGAGEGASQALLPGEGDFVVAVDGGLSFCEKMGIAPDLALGDFDSLSFVPDTLPVRRFPVEKDNTDMREAVLEALAQGCKRLHIWGGTGGRVDHTFANYQLLLQIAKAGGLGLLWGDTHLAAVVGQGKITFPKREKGDFSVFAFGGDAKGVSILGGKYQAEAATFSCDYPLGVSNSFIGKEVDISVEEGFLLLI